MTTTDSTSETCERRLKTEPKPRHQKEEPTWHYSGPPGPLGRLLGPWGWPITSCHLVLLPMIYTVDSKAVLGRFIQRWSGELTRIDDMAIPCPLLHLEYLATTPPWFLANTLPPPYIKAPRPPPRGYLIQDRGNNKRDISTTLSRCRIRLVKLRVRESRVMLRF